MDFPWTKMNLIHQHYSLVMLLMYLNLALGHGQEVVHVPSTRWCHFYNETVCPDGADSCHRKDDCRDPQQPGRRNMCFVLWRNSSADAIEVVLKGCIIDMTECYNQSECVAVKPANRGAYFCCCEGDNCNREFSWNVRPVTTTPTPVTERTSRPSEKTLIALVTLAPIVLVTVCVLVGFFVYRRRKPSYFNEIPSLDSGLACPPSPLPVARPVQLLEIVTRGRFVAIWRGRLRAEPVAVKIFPGHERRSWQAEREVLQLPQMNHENLVRFIDVEKHTDLAQVEYWILSEYCEHGSLCDYLKGHLVSWPEALRIAEGVARGLAHLHEEAPLSRAAGAAKPAVAHRDFKSKNVLLRADLTPCVADFGLALIFYPHRPIGDVHPQVGTRRYMAPEVLEGSICFHRDAFLRIDMYALGLVLWELASRCSAAPGPVADYRLPFEEEVGPHPSLDDMQHQVASRRVRPRLQPHWRLHQGLEVLCETAEDCWDNDAEARVSASCVLERMGALRHQQAAGAPALRSPSVPTVAAGAGSLAEPLLPPPPAGPPHQLSEPLLPPAAAPSASGPL
ncbi:activin receptor type-2B-like [Amphibalanus amphitrite]|uniref:activin receptor type-2B-like n=1 Tax=Amphibalanus amphitrite TaxID=1232801 RepID=UPI001C913E23|nr:activin receptor type-2B-like [Amphibalanus amphitrite]